MAAERALLDTGAVLTESVYLLGRVHGGAEACLELFLRGAAVHFTSSYGVEAEYFILHSRLRADAVILEALLGESAGDDLAPKLVRGLLDGRRHGHWRTTQENAFALLGLARYFSRFESEPPDFRARRLRGAAAEGRGDVRTGDLRSRRYESRGGEMSSFRCRRGSRSVRGASLE